METFRFKAKYKVGQIIEATCFYDGPTVVIDKITGINFKQKAKGQEVSYELRQNEAVEEKHIKRVVAQL